MNRLLAALAIVLALGASAHAQQKFKNLPSSSVPPNVGDTFVGVQNGQDVQFPAGSAPYLYHVTDYGATGNGVTDDTTAFVDALAACATHPGTVLIGAGTYLIASANLTVPAQCLLSSPSLPQPTSNFSQPSIILGNNGAGGTYTIILSESAVSNLAIFPYNLTAPATLRAAIIAAAAFTGTAITIAGRDTDVRNIFAVGFNNCVAGNGNNMGRLHLAHFKCDANAPFLINQSHDVTHIDDAEAWSFLTEANGATQIEQLSITGAANNGSGLIRLTVPTSTLLTNDVVTSASVGGFVGANQSQVKITVIDSTHADIQGSQVSPAFTGTCVNGSQIIRNVSSVNSLAAGQTLSDSSSHLPGGTTIVAVDPNQLTVTLSAAATGTCGTVTASNSSYTSGGTLTLRSTIRSGPAITVENSEGTMVRDFFAYDYNIGALVSAPTDNFWTFLLYFGCDGYGATAGDNTAICVEVTGDAAAFSWETGFTSAQGTGLFYNVTNQIGTGTVSGVHFAEANNGPYPGVLISIPEGRLIVSHSETAGAESFNVAASSVNSLQVAGSNFYATTMYVPSGETSHVHVDTATIIGSTVN